VPALVAVLSIASACGGGSGSPSAPTPTPATPTADPSISATITIRSIGPFNLSGTCYYHDHNDAENADLRGQIRIGVDSPGPGPGYLRP